MAESDNQQAGRRALSPNDHDKLRECTAVPDASSNSSLCNFSASFTTLFRDLNGFFLSTKVICSTRIYTWGGFGCVWFSGHGRQNVNLRWLKVSWMSLDHEWCWFDGRDEEQSQRPSRKWSRSLPVTPSSADAAQPISQKCVPLDTAAAIWVDILHCTIVLPTCPEIRCPAWRWCKAASLQWGFRTELRWKSTTSEMSHTSTTPAGFFSPNMNPASSSQASSSSFVVCWLTTSRVPELGVSRTVGMHRRCIGDAGFW